MSALTVILNVQLQNTILNNRTIHINYIRYKIFNKRGVFMVTALKEVLELKPNISGIDTKNTNPYCIITKEKEQSTAFCFSVPIYDSETYQIVRREFLWDGGTIRFSGSNAKGYINQGNLILSNKEGIIMIGLPNQKPQGTSEKVTVGSWNITPSFNGVHVHVNSNIAKFTIKTNREFSPQCSEKSFELMQSRFLPFFTLTPLFGRSNEGGASPCIVTYTQEDKLSYTVTIQGIQTNWLEFELNLYRPKLFQDTTVESMHPTQNNAFGGISFLGNTAQSGEQWLYSRLDTSKISEFYCTTIKKMVLHIPKWNCAETEIEISVPLKRFCSFGSTWENKVEHSGPLSSGVPKGDYLTIDATGLFANAASQTLRPSEGFVLKTKSPTGPAVVLSTGDNYTRPQILEIQYT